MSQMASHCPFLIRMERRWKEEREEGEEEERREVKENQNI